MEGFYSIAGLYSDIKNVEYLVKFVGGFTIKEKEENFYGFLLDDFLRKSIIKGSLYENSLKIIQIYQNWPFKKIVNHKLFPDKKNQTWYGESLFKKNKKGRIFCIIRPAIWLELVKDNPKWLNEELDEMKKRYNSLENL